MNRLFPSLANTSLGVRLGLAAASMSILLSAVLGELAGSFAEAQTKQNISRELTHIARQMSGDLDQNLFERYREIQIIAELKPFREAQGAEPDQQVLLDTLQRTYPNYSWIGFADRQGTVQVSTQGLLQGQSVAERDWFLQAQQRPYVGDVHEAVLLAKLLPHPDGDPLRFVDVAAPVYNRQGDFQGVLGAHLSWTWAEEVKGSLLNTPTTANKEILIVDRLGTVLLGSERWQGQTLNLESLRLAQTQREGSIVERWSDGNAYLVGFIRSQGYQSFPGLGWTILVYESADMAFAPARSLYWQILLGGVILGGGFAALSWAMAAQMTRPLLQIADAADQIRNGKREVSLPEVGGQSEITRLSQALTQLIANLLDRDHELSAANTNLETQLEARKRMGQALRRSQEQLRQIVDGIEDSLMLREIGTGKLIYSNAKFSAVYHQPGADNSDSGSWLRYVHPDDRAWVSKKYEAELRGEAFFNDNYRCLDGYGNVRWVWNRSFPIRNETGQIYRYVVIERDITALKRSAEILKTLMEGTAAVTGRAFFHKLVKHLALALDAEHVFVAECVEEEMQTLAFWSRGQLQPNITYSVHNTPCYIILNRGVYCQRDQVVQEFPENAHLVELRAEGYAGVALTNAAGEKIGALCVVREGALCDHTDYITLLQIFAHRAVAELERQRSETALQTSEARFRLLAENVKDLVCLHDLSGKFVYLSPSCQTLLGFHPDEMLGKHPYRYCHPDDRILMRLELRHIIRNGSSSPMTYRIRHQDGRYVWLESLIRVVCSSQGEPIYLQTSSRDVTEKVLAQQQLEHDATHDRLTGLPNRSLLLERLDLALERARTHEGCHFAVLFIDLDRFKVINDSLGHLTGDRLLQVTAHKLKQVIQSIDLVARTGGDEFVLLLEDIDGLQTAIRTAEQILIDFKTPIALDQHQVVVGASIGIVLGTTTYARSIDLLRDADIAMHSAKRNGKACYTIFNQTMHQQALQRLELENALRQALERQEFTLHYQPIMTLSTNTLAGFEALVRWQHPEQGLISPGEFIPVAEDTGLIVPLGEWILREACRQMALWQAQFPTSMLKISVNLSVQQLKEVALIAQIEQILRETGLAQHSLALEITESMFMEDIQAVNQRLQQLSDLSIQISIDDFGTGFSSLSYLHRLRVNTLKIDRSFVTHLFESHRNLNVAKTIIKLSEHLGFSAIAEGIETQEQLQQLKAFGCTMGQGYLFNAPMPSQLAEVLIAQLLLESKRLEGH